MSPQPLIVSMLSTLSGQTFATYGELERAVRSRLREHRSEFPSEFTYRDAIAWGTDSGLIAAHDNELVVTAPSAPSEATSDGG